MSLPQWVYGVRNAVNDPVNHSHSLIDGAREGDLEVVRKLIALVCQQDAEINRIMAEGKRKD